VLSDDELRQVWNEAETMSGPFGKIVQCLVLLGLRRTEAASIEKSWLQNDILVIPRTITKNAREFSLPLGDLSRAIVYSAAADSRSELVFGTLGGTIFRNWDHALGLLKAVVGFDDWSLHTLRHTYASNLARTGISLPVVEKLLNHVSGSFRGIVGVYQHHTFMPEMRDAVHKYETWFKENILR
jgi:integrase